jgi:hypothetical protein
MKRTTGYTNEVVVPAELMMPGFFTYNISVTSNDNKTYTYPSGLEGKPSDWDFYNDHAYSVNIINDATAPVYIFDAREDAGKLSREWLPSSALVPLAEPNKAELCINIDKLGHTDPEDKNAARIYDYSMRYSFKNKTAGRRDDLIKMNKLIVRGHSLSDAPCKLQIALVTKNGSAYGAVIALDTIYNDYPVALSDLRRVKLVILPRPYPSFLPYYFLTDTTSVLELSDVEVIQFSIGPGLSADDVNKKYIIAIESVRLE